MACDHLDKRTFDNAMENIIANYYSISSTFDGSFTLAMNDYYDAWQSKKGFERINTFYQAFANALETASKAIVKNYNIMKDSGETYAKDQGMWLIIGSIAKKAFSMDKKDFSEDREIIIDDEKISLAGENMKKSLEKINACLESLLTLTESDEKFGYYSEGGENPRLAMSKAFNALEDALVAATTKWSGDLSKDLDADKQLRESQKQAAAAQDSDFSGIFG